MSTETRRRASRRSVSSCDSPGPRVPTPPPSRSRCCHIPRMRGRLYSSWASSTWSLPSALTACWAKMSRISCVRSITRAPSASSRKRCCAGSSSPSTSTLSASASSNALLQLLELALADVGALRRPARDAGRSGRPARRRRCARAPRPRRARRRHRLPAPAPRARTRAPAPGNVESSGALCPPTASPPALAERTLALVDIASASRQEADGLRLREGERAARRSSTTTASRCSTRTRTGKPLVLLAGHTDTVPAQGNLPGPDRGRRRARRSARAT